MAKLRKFKTSDKTPYKSINVMVSTNLGNYKNKKYFVELSEGISIGGGALYGVSVWAIEKSEHCSYSSELFYDRNKAEKYIINLLEN